LCSRAAGHIAGVVNPPALGKYQYWTNDAKVETLDQFIEGATETKRQLVAALAAVA
jgi:polyhydroxyalkanoate synthase